VKEIRRDDQRGSGAQVQIAPELNISSRGQNSPEVKDVCPSDTEANQSEPKCRLIGRVQVEEFMLIAAKDDVNLLGRAEGAIVETETQAFLDGAQPLAIHLEGNRNLNYGRAY
jgi:hypothetical protein